MSSVTRRLLLKCFAIGSSVLSWRTARAATVAQKSAAPTGFKSAWKEMNNRVWLGADFWANPMEDWRVVDGAAECQTGGGYRNVHLITHQLTNTSGSFEMHVEIDKVAAGKVDAGAGFSVGIKSELNEYRSNSFSAGGINAGVVAGELRLGRQSAKLTDGDTGTKLSLFGTPAGNRYSLTLKSADESGKAVTEVTAMVPKEAMLGNIAIVNNFQQNLKSGQGGRYRFSNWTVDGDAFTVTNGQKFGPILWSMYTLSDSRSNEGFVMKISALTPPLGEEDNKTVELQVDRDGDWKSLGHAGLDPDAWVATFRVSNWDEKKEQKYRLVYDDKRGKKAVKTAEWSGTIKANPSGGPMRLGALTCQNHYGFPYEPVANNLVKLDPDMLYFSGDQLYESHGGYGLIRDPAGPAILKLSAQVLHVRLGVSRGYERPTNRLYS